MSRILFAFFAIIFACIAPANAALRVDITRANPEPMPIALPNLA